MVVPSIADEFKASVIVMWFLNEKGVMSFHTNLSDKSCVRLLLKNLDKGMPESVV